MQNPNIQNQGELFKKFYKHTIGIRNLGYIIHHHPSNFTSIS